MYIYRVNPALRLRLHKVRNLYLFILSLNRRIKQESIPDCTTRMPVTGLDLDAEVLALPPLS